MIVFSALTIDHFFAANYPETIFAGSFCDINAFFNCDSSAFSSISAILGVPMGYFGLVVGALVALGALFPSDAFDRTNGSIALLNAMGVVALFAFSVFVLGSLCLLCSGYYVFALASFGIFSKASGRRFFRPSTKYLATAGVVTLAGAWAIAEYHDARRQAQSGGVAAQVVEEFFHLDPVAWPSEISPLWTVKSTERFEDAPIRIVEYADPLCPDCRVLDEQLDQLKEEFAGKINIAFQFFPLEAPCNDVVEKDLHPGACDVSYMAAYDPAKFNTLVDELFANVRTARDPEWRAEFAKRHGVEAALEDQATKDLVHRLIRTGTEYEKTSDRYSHGIRSTPTMIINGRMVIGTLPIEQLRAIFQALVAEAEGRRFMESWVG
jgi:uncharacterized membrane protein/predicted DsbA family dithiol-disulfide isomerase